MEIKIIRGTHQIGGCITEIKSSKTRIIIDIGAELPSVDKNSNADFNIEGVTTGAPDCDAVLATHYHGDHIGMYEKVLPDVPIYMGKVAKEILLVVQKAVQKRLKKGNPELVEAFKTFSPGRPFKIKDITVTPLMVDHSAFDAYMFLIECEGKRILHTGDFRTHGPRGGKLQEVLEKYAPNIDVLITEGTMLSRQGEEIKTERQLGLEAEQFLKDNHSTFVLISSTNIDSIAEFYHAAHKTGRVFVVCDDDFHAEILRVVQRQTKTSFYDFKKFYSYGENLNDYMRDKGFCMVGTPNATMKRAMKNFPKHLLIYSQWLGYIQNTQAFDAYKADFISASKAMGGAFEYLHTSGHAGADAIKMVCDVTSAKIIIPVHVEQPKQFLNLGIKGEIKILSDGESIVL